MRTALVTGASRGIGRGIAMSLARQGFGLTITSRAEKDLQVLAQELLAEGAPAVVHHAADVADRAALPSLVATHEARFTTMDALVVNAGIGTAGTVAKFDLARLDRTLDVNFTSALILVQAALPLLRRGAQADPDRGARIVGLSSLTGVYPERGLAVYGASKAALISLLATVSREEARHGVLATAIAPGYVETDMSEWITDKIPASSMLRVSDVVAAVDMVLGLSRNALINEIVMVRSDSDGYTA